MTLGCRITAAVKRKAGTKVQQRLNANSPHFSNHFSNNLIKKAPICRSSYFNF